MKIDTVNVKPVISNAPTFIVPQHAGCHKPEKRMVMTFRLVNQLIENTEYDMRLEFDSTTSALVTHYLQHSNNNVSTNEQNATDTTLSHTI